MRVVLAVLVALGLLAGCGESPQVAAGRDGSGVAADCSVAVQYEGRTYVERGFTDVEAERVGVAVLASCDDTGENARGSYFGEGSEKVPVWTFAGHGAAEVLGLEIAGTYRVMVLEGRADELAAQLQAAGILDAAR